jgi:hypothetical protein
MALNFLRMNNMNRDKSNNCDIHIRIINTLRNEQYFVKEMAVQYTSIVENMQHSVSNSENSYLFMRQKIQFTRRTINHLLLHIKSIRMKILSIDQK